MTEREKHLIEQGDIYYFSWVIAYDFNLKEIGEHYGIYECDKLYDFCNYIATWYVKNSEEYKNLKYSSYEMFYEFIDNHKGLENLFKDYFNITYNKVFVKPKDRIEICSLYNDVGDYDCLEYIKSIKIKDERANEMLENMLDLNKNMLDTPVYYDYRKMFFEYLGFKFDKNGNLKK